VRAFFAAETQPLAGGPGARKFSDTTSTRARESLQDFPAPRVLHVGKRFEAFLVPVHPGTIAGREPFTGGLSQAGRINNSPVTGLIDLDDLLGTNIGEKSWSRCGGRPEGDVFQEARGHAAHRRGRRRRGTGAAGFWPNYDWTFGKMFPSDWGA